MQLLGLWLCAGFPLTILGQHIDSDANHDYSEVDTDSSGNETFWIGSDSTNYKGLDTISEPDEGISTIMSIRELFESESNFSKLYARVPTKTSSGYPKDKPSPDSSSRRESLKVESPEQKSSDSRSSGGISNKKQQLRTKPASSSSALVGDVILSGQGATHERAHYDTFRHIDEAYRNSKKLHENESNLIKAKAREDEQGVKKFHEAATAARMLSEQHVNQALKHYDTAHTAMISHTKLRKAGWKYLQGLTSGKEGEQGESKHIDPKHQGS